MKKGSGRSEIMRKLSIRTKDGTIVMHFIGGHLFFEMKKYNVKNPQDNLKIREV